MSSFFGEKSTRSAELASEVGTLRLTKLLDVLVQECGYPMHLQVTSNEFLKRFIPTRPEGTEKYDRVSAKKLYLLNLWDQTFAQHSKYKNDFTSIRKRCMTMKLNSEYILLTLEYAFPDPDPQAVAKLNDAVRGCSSLQYNSDSPGSTAALASLRRHAVRLVSFTKLLQEHVRRGTPMDLRKAQELMEEIIRADVCLLFCLR